MKIDRDILIGGNSFEEIFVPGLKRIDPTRDGVYVMAELLNRKLSTPPVVAEQLHGNFRPRFVILVAVSHNALNRLVPIGEDIRFNSDRFPDNPFDRKPPAFEFRLHPPNDHSLRRPLAHI